jgi:hypothetical protein
VGGLASWLNHPFRLKGASHCRPAISPFQEGIERSIKEAGQWSVKNHLGNPMARTSEVLENLTFTRYCDAGNLDGYDALKPHLSIILQLPFCLTESCSAPWPIHRVPRLYSVGSAEGTLPPCKQPGPKLHFSFC